MTKEQPNYYATIPAPIRYDNSLIPNAKLLYGEITALCNKNGYCWASNNYFAELYQVSNKTISNWIKSLKEKGYIDTKLIYREGTKEIVNRYIQIIPEGIEEKFRTPMEEKVKENNTSINNNKKIYKKRNLESKKRFGSLENVFLTGNELIKLKERFTDYEDRIENLSLYISSTGKKYSNHYATILTWDRRDKKKQQESKKEERAYGTYIN